ncbi:MAG TPA: hypothetical protein VMW91_09160 [Desulfosporosinus sp.]|nr:hypothetical protein [Desulfosporosinus sp.]
MVDRIQWYCGPKLDGVRANLKELEKYGNRVAERKKDGRWCAIHVDHFQPQKHKFESRAGNDHNGSLIQGLNNLDLGNLGKDTILVGELEAGTEAANKRFAKLGYRRVWLFDVVLLRGHDLRKMILKDRRTLLRETIWNMLPEKTKQFLLLVEDTNKGFIKFYDSTLKIGDEGVVVKRVDVSGWSYRASGKTDDWVRVKPMQTIDYAVMGPDRTDGGELTARLGLWDNGKLRKVLKYQLPKMTLLSNGSLAEEGCVVEMYGRELFESGSLRSAQFLRWREDKTPNMCDGTINRVVL